MITHHKVAAPAQLVSQGFPSHECIRVCGLALIVNIYSHENPITDTHLHLNTYENPLKNLYQHTYTYCNPYNYTDSDGRFLLAD